MRTWPDGRLAAIALLGLVGLLACRRGAPPSGAPSPILAEASLASRHAGRSQGELRELLDERTRQLMQLQEQLAMELIDLGLYEQTAVDSLDGWEAPTGDPADELEAWPGFRVDIRKAATGFVVRTVRIPPGFDAAYDELKREVVWLSRAVEV